MSVKQYKVTDFTGVVVTGGSSGIGQSFFSNIFKVNPDASFFNLSRTFPEKKFCEADIQHIPCDLSDASALKHAAQELLSKLPDHGPILLINNSGFGSYGYFKNEDLERQATMIDLNARAPVLLTGCLMARLKAQGGAVVNIASTASFQPTPYMSTYGATKSFLRDWSLALNHELREEDIHVMVVCPGPTATNFFRNAGFSSSPLPSFIGQTSEQVVLESLSALEKSRPLVVTGWSNKFMTCLSGKLPKVMVTRLSGKILKRIRLGD